MTVSDFSEERRAKIKANNEQNKRRGKQMERRVMKILKGNRVPMSGSGAIKGDGQVFSEVGYILVECKCSAAINSQGDQKLRVDFRWLTKMQVEATIMNAKFPVLVIHHIDAKQDYVILREDYFEKYFRMDIGDMLPYKVIDLLAKNGWNAVRKQLELDFSQEVRYIVLDTSLGKYVLCTLGWFAQLLEDKHENTSSF